MLPCVNHSQFAVNVAFKEVHLDTHQAYCLNFLALTELWGRGSVAIIAAWALSALGISLTVAAAISLFGFHSGAALATVVGVLIEVPVMLLVVSIVNRSKGSLGGEAMPTVRGNLGHSPTPTERAVHQGRRGAADRRSGSSRTLNSWRTERPRHSAGDSCSAAISMSENGEYSRPNRANLSPCYSTPTPVTARCVLAIGASMAGFSSPCRPPRFTADPSVRCGHPSVRTCVSIRARRPPRARGTDRVCAVTRSAHRA